MESVEKETVVLQNDYLRIAFHWQGDRYAHTIGLFGDERQVPLLVSLEGAGQQRWPPSPAFQAVEVVPVGDHQIAMLVGMAGRSHWSAAVEFDMASNRLRMDVACRLKDEPAASGDAQDGGLDGIPGSLGSAYTATAPATVVRKSANLVRVGPLEISVVDVADTTTDTTANNTQAKNNDVIAADSIRVSDTDFTIHPVDGDDGIPRTVRWAYTIAASDR